MPKKTLKKSDYIERIRDILASARQYSLRAVNSTMVAAYWYIGREIIEEEQQGKKRAAYGEAVIENLVTVLQKEFGKGFSKPHLKNVRQFYLAYSDRAPAMSYTVSSQSKKQLFNKTQQLDFADKNRIGYTVCSQSNPLSPELSWSHYRLLMRVSRSEARAFYEAECIKAGWSVRELERQISSLLFDRLAKSRDKKGLLALANKGHEVFRIEDVIKDPYVLEFTGLPEPPQFTESQLEEALITSLQKFLLELGHDFMFVARQRRITIDGDHFFIDLVFYHRTLRCFVLIDLKIGKLTQQDVGQMLLYTGYFKSEEMYVDENPPVGLILCTEKNEAAVRYTLSDTTRKVFAAKYQMHLPTVEELAEELQRERAAIEGKLNVPKSIKRKGNRRKR